MERKDQTDNAQTPLDKTMTARYAAAKKKRGERIAQGDRHKKHISATVATEDPIGDDIKSQRRSHLPLHGRFASTLISSIYFREPRIVSKLRDPMDKVQKARTEVELDILNYVVRETGMMRHARLALTESIPYGTGSCKVDWDSVRRVPCVGWIPFRYLSVDADDDCAPLIENKRWVAEEYTVDYETAKKNWPDHKFDNLNQYSEDIEPVQKDPAVVYESSLSVPDDQRRVKCLRVWVKGDNPETPDGNIKAGPGEEVEKEKPESGKEEKPEADAEEGDDDLFDGKDEILIFEIRGKDGCQLQLLERTKNDIITDHDDFVVEFFRPTIDTDQFLAYSILDPFDALQKNADSGRAHEDFDCEVAAGKRVLYDKKIFKEEDIRKMFNGGNYEGIGVDNPGDAERGFKVIDFKPGNKAIAENAAANYALYNDTTGVTTMEGGEGVQRSATGAQLMDRRVQLMVGPYSDAFEIFVTNLIRKLLQAARSLMTPEDVERIVGAEKMAKLQAEIGSDENGQPYELWPEMPDPEFVRRETNVTIEAHSMRYVSSEQTVTNIKMLLDAQMGVVNSILAVAPQNGALAMIIAKISNTAFLRMADELQITNKEELLFSMNDLFTALKPPAPPPPQPQAPQMMAPPAGMPQPGMI